MSRREQELRDMAEQLRASGLPDSARFAAGIAEDYADDLDVDDTVAEAS